jgi:hypothetical protein
MFFTALFLIASVVTFWKVQKKIRLYADTHDSLQALNAYSMYWKLGVIPLAAMLLMALFGKLEGDMSFWGCVVTAVLAALAWNQATSKEDRRAN